MSTKVQTVTGPIDSADLGKTLIHEHVLIGFPGWFMDARQPAFQRREAIERVVDVFQQLHAYGVKTIIDPCPMDLGRDVEMNAEVSQKTGINLISATGAYVEAMGIPYTLQALSEDGIVEGFCKEIEDGVANTGIRCGVIKIATGDGKVSDYERKILRAAARAAKQTGVPLISHTEHCSCGHDQIDIAEAAGLPTSSLIVGHSCGSDDHPYQKSLADRGAYVGFDRFGLEQEVSDVVRTKNLKAMIDVGHKSRVLVSHDSVNCWQGAMGDTDPAELNKAMPNWKMTHLFENIFPELKRMGVSDADLDHIVTANPRRYFEEAMSNAKV